MEPTLEVDDVVIVKKTIPQELKVGDIVTFLEEERTISHRIIDITEVNGGLKFQTKGDNNEVPDNFNLDGNQIYGKVLFKISGIGGIVGYIQNINGFINGFILILIVFALIGLRDKQKNTRKIKRRKYEIKKLRDNYNI